MEAIKQWLVSSKDYNEGVALYIKHGKNAALKRMLGRSVAGGQIAQKMEYELQKLAAAPMRKKRKPTKKPKAAKAEPAPSAYKAVLDKVTLPEANAIDVAAYSESRFDEIIFEELPEELKPAYLKIIDLAKAARKAHWELRGVDLAEKEKRRAMTQFIVETKDEEQRLYERINHWREHGEVLSDKTATEDVAAMLDLQLERFKNNRKASVSRYTKRAAKFESELNKCTDGKKRQYLKHQIVDAKEKLNQHRANLEAATAEIKNRLGKC